MLVIALVCLAVTCGILAAALLVAEHTIRVFKDTVKVNAATERRLVQNVRRLQEELVHHAVEAQVVTIWRNRRVTLS